jgi:hypothetical protein
VLMDLLLCYVITASWYVGMVLVGEGGVLLVGKAQLSIWWQTALFSPTAGGSCLCRGHFLLHFVEWPPTRCAQLLFHTIITYYHDDKYSQKK